MTMPLRRVLRIAAVAAGVFGVSAALSFVAAGGRRAAPQPRVQMQAVSVNDKSDNFIDKAFTAMTDVVIGLIPLSQQEKDAYQFYRDGMAAQVSGDYSMALRSYAEALKLEEDPIDRSYIFYNLGIIFGSNGEYVKAVKYYHLSLDQNKELCQAYNNIAVIYHDQAMRAEKKGALDKSTVLYDKAALYWNQAIRIAPTNYLEAQNWLITTGRISSEAQSKLGGLRLGRSVLALAACSYCAKTETIFLHMAEIWFNLSLLSTLFCLEGSQDKDQILVFCQLCIRAQDIANDGVFARMHWPQTGAGGQSPEIHRMPIMMGMLGSWTGRAVVAQAPNAQLSNLQESVDEPSFLAFFAGCEKESTNGEAAEFPSKEDLQRLFTYWDEAGAGHLSEVVSKTTITDSVADLAHVCVSVKATSVSKLEVGDVVEVLGVATKEPEVDVMRVKVRLLTDGTEGWATISGNQGTDYLQEGGGSFKVVKETLLTDDFEIGAAKETPKELNVSRMPSSTIVVVPTCQSCAGKLLQLPYEKLLLCIEQDFARGASAALHMDLNKSCEPMRDLVDFLREVMEPSSRKNVKDWRCIMNKRIGESYKAKNRSLSWLDDKVVQVTKTAEVLGAVRHLPILGCGGRDGEGQQALRAAASREVELDTPLVVKPRHGSNSKFVAMFPSPAQAGVEAVCESIDAALNGEDPSWKKESWNQNAVPKGALLQPLYALMADMADVDVSMGARNKLMRPLELKVQVLFGVAVGGCLHSHPMALWVLSSGAVQLWDPNLPGLLKKGHGVWEPLPHAILETLLRSLSEDWEAIRGDSERLAQEIGLDELRVDWLLGDGHWGPRIGELTYMGTLALDIWPVSWRLARAFAAGHLSRLGRPLQPFPERGSPGGE
ncbi:ycf3 [Symbiodinium natans]|uniref:Ycf3 protein n=1 Tax=Symbiodinium natans TaxID=878477 RepID=A0A812S7J9_9DINO|nr:ycf3 [Symbiodinium natans]